jgi:cell pole-organizing protein PopZ
MVAEQANCSPIAALALMHERAVAQGRSLDEVATAVVAREDRFGM